MKKKTPQEIADFFGCFVAQYRNSEFWVYKNRPQREDGYWVNGSFACGRIERCLVDSPADHDWKTLYVPAGYVEPLEDGKLYLVRDNTAYPWDVRRFSHNKDGVNYFYSCDCDWTGQSKIPVSSRRVCSWMYNAPFDPDKIGTK